ncbi:hypothetical protein [Psychroserpens jangbogonensis]|uniref:hypothetical protein n=1 Tax=Psychroserpens jangbogonensis TaxID=1484460 RepID=UPI00053EB9F7|nr:hypothetical protein [Psychroserpens jangbogonensis]
MNKQEITFDFTRKYIDDFIITTNNLTYSIHHINWWLMKYEAEFYEAISKSNCGKWSKWVRDNSIHVFPCACPTREQECIFIELYFELLKVSELEPKEIFFEKIMKEYKIVQHDEDEINLWLDKHKVTWKGLRFDEIIRVKLTTEPYTKIEVQLAKCDFRNIILFQKTYNRLHYSKEF